ncbi:MAG: hypothetical protein K2V38_22240 [Gemmataceae bacterium]|nr:hypothetical protein [Gemmataceae bacterium]
MTHRLEKWTGAAEGHGTKIVVIEQQLSLLVELKATVTAVASLKEEMIAVRKDLESLQGWKAEQKKEREESARRWWAFGPNITGAIVSGAIALLGVLVSYFVNRAK